MVKGLTERLQQNKLENDEYETTVITIVLELSKLHIVILKRPTVDTQRQLVNRLRSEIHIGSTYNDDMSTFLPQWLYVSIHVDEVNSQR